MAGSIPGEDVIYKLNRGVGNRHIAPHLGHDLNKRHFRRQIFEVKAKGVF